MEGTHNWLLAGNWSFPDYKASTRLAQVAIPIDAVQVNNKGPNKSTKPRKGRGRRRIPVHRSHSLIGQQGRTVGPPGPWMGAISGSPPLLLLMDYLSGPRKCVSNSIGANMNNTSFSKQCWPILMSFLQSMHPRRRPCGKGPLWRPNTKHKWMRAQKSYQHPHSQNPKNMGHNGMPRGNGSHYYEMLPQVSSALPPHTCSGKAPPPPLREFLQATHFQTTEPRTH